MRCETASSSIKIALTATGEGSSASTTVKSPVASCKSGDSWPRRSSRCSEAGDADRRRLRGQLQAGLRVGEQVTQVYKGHIKGHFCMFIDLSLL